MLVLLLVIAPPILENDSLPDSTSLDKEYPNCALIERAVKVATPDGGKAILEPGLVFEVKSKTNSSVRIQYQNSDCEIPISATYLTHEKASPTPQVVTPDEASPTPPRVSNLPSLEKITLAQPVIVQALYGSTTLPIGTEVELVSQDASNAHIRYAGRELIIPSSALTPSK